MDYVVIAINPALVMVLVGSLIYFLLELFYQGQYPNKLHFCLTMFIFAAVLISRISMEEGWERAAPFGLALGVAICLAMRKYVEYPPGSPMEAYGWLLNYSLIALAWWCAHQLTWDSTLVDETQDASGEGLLQSTGLDSAESVVEKDAVDGKNKSANSNSAGKAAPADSKSTGSSSTGAEAEVDWASVVTPVQPSKRLPKPKKSAAASLSTQHDSLVAEENDAEKQSWWQRMMARRRRAHAPGVWVVYFSLFALPMFGLGQAFIPVSNTAGRRYAFLLLCVYVASALGLLLTTSFLGLRRYLRQRKLEMPAAMAGVWLATGAILIAVLIGLTALLPRPNAEYQISQSPFADSEDQNASSVAPGGEGTKDDQATTADGTRSKPEKDAQSSDQSTGPHPEGRDPSKTSGTKSTDGEAKKSGGGEGKSNESSGDKSDHQQSSADNSKNISGESKQSKSDGERGGQNSGSEKSSSNPKSGSQSEQSNSQSNQQKSQPSQNSSSENKSQSNQNNAHPNQNNSPGSQSPATPPTPDLSIIGTSLQNMVKWVVYVLLGLLAVWLLFAYWSDVLSWINRFLQSWQDFFARLFGGGRDAGDEEAAAPRAKPKSFFQYPDPFDNGHAARMKPGELVRYSFEALEAWAFDNGCPRQTDQTPLEFAKQIGEHSPNLATAARTLTELYNRQAYAKGTLTAASVEHVRNFWLAILEPATQGAERGG
jgi:hypothetical protein